jgi:hypothetical protein
MAKTFGIAGRLVSWAGYSGLVSGGVKQNSLTFNTSAGPLDVTGTTSLANVVSQEFIPDLVSGTLTHVCWLNPAIKGNESAVTLGTGIYQIPSKNFTLSITIPSGETTEHDSSNGVDFKSYVPGPYTWNASVLANFDDAIALVLPGRAPASCVFKINDASPDNNTFTGNAFAEVYSPSIDPNSLSELPITLKGTGSLTVAGSTNPLFSVGAIGAFTVGAIEFQLNGGTTIEAEAFATQIDIVCNPSQPVQVTTQIQLTGELEINP